MSKVQGSRECKLTKTPVYVRLVQVSHFKFQIVLHLKVLVTFTNKPTNNVISCGSSIPIPKKRKNLFLKSIDIENTRRICFFSFWYFPKILQIYQVCFYPTTRYFPLHFCFFQKGTRTERSKYF